MSDLARRVKNSIDEMQNLRLKLSGTQEGGWRDTDEKLWNDLDGWDSALIGDDMICRCIGFVEEALSDEHPET